jgi:tetratricopeptide (TPR) repeat protein
LDILATLADSSLLRQQTGPGGEPRVTMLATVRELAGERLAEAGAAEVAAVRRRHAAWFLALVEAAETRLQGAEQHVWLARLDLEQDNLRAALATCRDTADTETALRLAAALSRYWNLRGHVSEGRGWLEMALALPLPLPDDASEGGESLRLVLATRAKALTRAAASARRQGDYAIARSFLDESISLWTDLGDAAGLAYALHGLGQIDLHQGAYQQARAHLKESVRLFQEAGDTWGLTGALGSLGEAAVSKGDYTLARRLYEDVLAAARRAGYTGRIAGALSDLGELARVQGDDERAAALYDESLALARALGNKVSVANVLHNAGHIALHQRAPARAARRFAEGLTLFREIGDRRGEAACIAGLAGVAAAQARPRRAARLLAFSEALCQALGARLPPGDRAEMDRNRSVARAQLDAADFDAELAAGRVLSLDQAVAEALDEAAHA